MHRTAIQGCPGANQLPLPRAPALQVRSLAGELVRLAQKAPTSSLNAVYKKYANAKFMEIAKVEPAAAVADEADALVA